MALLKDLGSLWWQVSNNNEFTIAVTISVIIAMIIWCTLSLSSSSQTLPPGPRSLPIVGYLPFLNPELHKQFTNLAHTYGPIFKIYLGSKLHIVINTPELVKVVVRDQDEIFSNRDLTVAASAYSYEGRDLVLSNNNANWRNLRKMFVHELLSKKNLEACSSFRRYEVRKTINNIFSKIGTKINIYEISFSTEANVIASMVWENTYVKGTHDSDFGAELQMVSAKVNEIFGQLNLSDFFPSLAWFDLNGIKREMLRQRNKLDKLMTGIIEDQSKEKSQDGVGDSAKKDFLQKLLDLKDDQKDPKSVNLIQIKALLSISYYTKEKKTTRRYPVFKPERFLTYDEKNKWDYTGNNLHFFPFGSGRRSCAGLPVAERMQMFVLASLLHSFDWSLPKGEEHDLSDRFRTTLKRRKPLVAIPSLRLSDPSLYN
ncbi:cytochrome P450 [Artemisia annua]|uniref:Cytochrome P450 n=1 Tax=Artemisia annua TaxID=35608 RepID=A0A2U1N3D6_ARTAN|nr:cytochrome P450 [Artemisia annua]